MDVPYQSASMDYATGEARLELFVARPWRGRARAAALIEPVVATMAARAGVRYRLDLVTSPASGLLVRFLLGEPTSFEATYRGLAVVEALLAQEEGGVWRQVFVKSVSAVADEVIRLGAGRTNAATVSLATRVERARLVEERRTAWRLTGDAAPAENLGPGATWLFLDLDPVSALVLLVAHETARASRVETSDETAQRVYRVDDLEHGVRLVGREICSPATLIERPDWPSAVLAHLGADPLSRVTREGDRVTIRAPRAASVAGHLLHLYDLAQLGALLA